MLAGLPGPSNTTAPYFIEEVRQHLERQYGAQALYEFGLSVQTTLDYDLQAAANQGAGPRAAATSTSGGASASRRRTSRPTARPRPSIASAAGTVPIRAGDIVPAVVMEVAASAARTRTPPAARPGQPLPPGTARLRVGKYEGILEQAGFRWTGRASAADLVKVGDLVEVEVTAVDDAAGAVSVALEQTPLVEGALLAIDNRTGQIRAMVGGFDFGRSKFNRAVQAPRQVGSAFKPIVLHGRDRSRLHAGIAHRRRAGVVPRRARPAARTRRRTTTASTRARSRCGGCSSSRATCPP